MNEKTWLRERIDVESEIQLQFIKKQIEFAWHRFDVEAYMIKIIEWRDLLLTLIHMIDEQSVRNLEILSVHHSNINQRLMRNVFIENDKVVMISRYRKEYRIIDNEKIIHRYWSRAVEQLLIYYMWLMRSFQKMIETIVWKKKITSTLIWSFDLTETSWKIIRMSKVINRISNRWMKVEIEIAAWREMIIEIARRYLRKDYAFERDENDLKELNENHNVIFDRQIAHEFHVIESIYARSLTIISDVIEKEQLKFRAISETWHEFLELVDEKVELRKRQRNLVNVQNVRIARIKRLCTIDIEKQLMKMLKIETRFRNCQREVIQVIMNENNFVMIVMSIDEKESLTFMLSTWFSRSEISVVVISLIAFDKTWWIDVEIWKYCVSNDIEISISALRSIWCLSLSNSSYSKNFRHESIVNEQSKI